MSSKDWAVEEKPKGNQESTLHRTGGSTGKKDL